MDFSPETVSIDLIEESEFIRDLNATGLRCEHCGADESLVAVARFHEMPLALALCGGCYRELIAFSLGTAVDAVLR